MNELKNQPIDKRTTSKYATRNALISAAYLSGIAICMVAAPKITEALKYGEYAGKVRAAAVIALAIMFIRSLYRNYIKKWCYAYINYIYDCMERADTENCPRCQTAFAVDYSNPGKPKSCPNKNCKISLENRLTYSQMPATNEAAKALVMNMGIYDDFKHSTSSVVFSWIGALIVSAAVGVGIVWFAVPYVADLVQSIKDLM